MDAHGPSLWATLGAVNARRTARPSRRTRGGATLVVMTTRSLILAAGALELALASMPEPLPEPEIDPKAAVAASPAVAAEVEKERGSAGDTLKH